MQQWLSIFPRYSFCLKAESYAADGSSFFESSILRTACR